MAWPEIEVITVTLKASDIGRSRHIHTLPVGATMTRYGDDWVIAAPDRPPYILRVRSEGDGCTLTVSQSQH